MLMALRGAGQFGNIPWIHYQSCIWGGEHPMPGTLYGKAPGQLRREMFAATTWPTAINWKGGAGNAGF